MGTRTEDFVEHLLVASTHSYLLIFTNRGRVYWLKIYEIPDASTTGKGKHISQPDQPAARRRRSKAFLAVKDFVPDQFIVMVTKHGVIKKCELTEFDNPMSRGIIALALDEGDELIAARITNGDNYIFLGSHEGQAIRFAEKSRARRWAGRRAAFAPWIWSEGDYLVGMEVVEKDGLILSIAENGYGKRTPLEDYRLTARGGKGVINMKTTKQDRQGGGDPLGEGRFRPDDRHPGRQDHPHRIRRDPPGRPLHARRAPGAHGRRRQVAAASRDSGIGNGKERPSKRTERSAVTVE